jgi:transcriptional regulator with XRE-family HTH domain
MNNRLPEKLSLLRKHYGYSQGDLAERLGINVTEYMKWENGSQLPRIGQLKKLADLFHAEIDVLLDNTRDLDIPEDQLGNSVQIPFLDGVGATQDLSPTADTDEIETDEGGTTKQFTVPEEEPKEPVKKPSPRREVREKEPVRKKVPARSKKHTGIIIGVAAAAVAVIILVILLLPEKGATVTLGTVNRLTEGDRYTLYVDSNGKLQTSGQFSGSGFDGALQVDAFGSHASGLMSDGTVVTNGMEDVSSFKNITMVASGADHTVGLSSDGSVQCAGDDNACQVSGWSDITAVYAGDGTTVGLKKDGTLVYSGAGMDALNNVSDVIDVDLGTSEAAVVFSDGSVRTYGIGTGTASPHDTSSFKDVREVEVGDGFVVALTSRGRVLQAGLSTTQEEDSEEKPVGRIVQSWSDIRYLAAGGKTIVAVDKSGAMHGAGDNTYQQYEEAEPSPSASADTKKLDTPQNIQVSETTTNIVIKWDSVENADYYSVTFGDQDLGEASTNSASVPASSLEDGKSYTISVTAHSNSDKEYESSEEATYSYTFTDRSKKLEAPSSISTKYDDNGNPMVQWAPVDQASGYIVTVRVGGSTSQVEVAENWVSLSNLGSNQGGQINVSIIAKSDSTAYKNSDDSEPVQLNLCALTLINSDTAETVTVTVFQGSELTPEDLAVYGLEASEINSAESYTVPNTSTARVYYK